MNQFGRQLVPTPLVAFFDKCPFNCDGMAKGEEWENLRMKRIEYFMRCDKCGAIGPSCETQEAAHERWGAVVRAVAILNAEQRLPESHVVLEN